MANLTSQDKQILEKLFKMESGYVLNFLDKTMMDFFTENVKINIYSNEYANIDLLNFSGGRTSKANYIRNFWLKGNDEIVAKSILELIKYIENQIFLEKLSKDDFPDALINKGKAISTNLTNKQDNSTVILNNNNSINITLQKDIFAHVQNLLNNGSYYNAVEESYKLVRQKLKAISGEEKATDAFNEKNYDKIFGYKPSDHADKDFFEAVKFLHMAIQFLRNQKAHTPAKNMNRNLAIHYISLSSLAYELITRDTHPNKPNSNNTQ